MRKALIAIAQKGFQEVELKGTRDGLVEAKFEVILASSEIGECIGKFGGREQASVAMRDVVVTDYDRIAFIGGPGANNLWKDRDATRLAREFFEAGKVTSAICIAPKILAAAGVL